MYNVGTLYELARVHVLAHAIVRPIDVCPGGVRTDGKLERADHRTGKRNEMAGRGLLENVQLNLPNLDVLDW